MSARQNKDKGSRADQIRVLALLYIHTFLPQEEKGGNDDPKTS